MRNVRKLRDTLQLTKPAFARLVGVDFRTVIRWENGDTEPTGAAAAVIEALRICLAANPTRRAATLDFVRHAARLGGLGYLLVHLLALQQLHAPDANALRAKRRIERKRRD